MRKLVLGIIAVTLLQIGFALYTSTYEPAGTALLAVKTNRVNTGPRLDRARDLPKVKTPLIPTTADESSQKTTAAKKAVKADLSRGTVKRQMSVGSASLPEQYRRARTPDTAQVSPSKPAKDWTAQPAPARTVIPKGYTMALVDYLPATASDRTHLTSNSGTPDISEPRKRSYLARALPALVKKPWSWVKSIASKLD